MVLPPLGSSRRGCGLWILHTIATLTVVGTLTDQKLLTTAQYTTSPGPSIQPSVPEVSSYGPANNNEITSDQLKSKPIENTNGPTTSSNYTPSKATVKKPGDGTSIKKVYKPGKFRKKKIYRPGKTIRKKIRGGNSTQKVKPGKTLEKNDYNPGKTIEKNDYTPGKTIEKNDYTPGKTIEKNDYTPGKTIEKNDYTPGKTIEKNDYNPGKTIKKKVYKSGKTIKKKIYRPGKTIRKKIDMKKVYVPGRTVILKEPIGPTYSYRKVTIPGKTAYKKIRIPGRTITKKEVIEPVYDYEEFTIPGKQTVMKVKTLGGKEVKKVLLKPKYRKKRVYEEEDEDEEYEEPDRYKYKIEKVPGKITIKKIKTPPVYVYDKTRVPGETKYKKARVPGKTVIDKIPTPAEFSTKKILIPGKKVTKPNPYGTKVIAVKKYIPEEYGFKTVEIPGESIIKKQVVPGKTIKKKIPYSPTYDYKKVYIDGKPVIKKIRVPGKTELKKIEIPAEYGYKVISIPGKPVVRKIKVPGKTKSEKYVKKATYKYQKRTIPGSTSVKKIRIPGKTVTKKIAKEPIYLYKKVPVDKKIIKKIRIPGKTVKIKVPTNAEYRYVKFTAPGGTKTVKIRIPGKTVTEGVRIPEKYGYKTIKQEVPPSYKKIYVPGQTIVQKVFTPKEQVVDVYLPPDQEYVEEYYDTKAGTYLHRLQHCSWNIDENHYTCTIKRDSVDELLQPSTYHPQEIPPEQRYIEEYFDKTDGSTKRRLRVCVWRADIRDTDCRTEEIRDSVTPEQQISDPGTSITNIYLPPNRVYTEEYLNDASNTIERKLKICTWDIEDKRYKCTNKVMDDNESPGDSGVEAVINEFVDISTGSIKYSTKVCKLSAEYSKRECMNESGVSSDGYRPLRPLDQRSTTRDFENQEYANDIVHGNFRIETTYWPDSKSSHQRVYIYQYLDKPSRKYRRRLMACRLNSVSSVWECATSNDHIVSSPLDIAQINPSSDRTNTIKLSGPTEIEVIHLSGDRDYPSDRIYDQEYVDPITNSIQRRAKTCTYRVDQGAWECSITDTGSTYGQLSQREILPDDKETIEIYLDSSSGKITQSSKVCRAKSNYECETRQSRFGGFKPLLTDGSGYSRDFTLYSGLRIQDLYWPEIHTNLAVPNRVYIYEFVDQTIKQTERRVVICKYDAYSQSWVYTTVPAEKLPTPLELDETNRPDQDKEVIGLSNKNVKESIHIPPEKVGYSLLPADRVYVQEYFEAAIGFVRRRTKICSFNAELQKWVCHDKTEDLNGTDPFTDTIQLPADRTYVDEYINTDTGQKSVKTTICRYNISKSDWVCTNNTKTTTINDLEENIVSNYAQENDRANRKAEVDSSSCRMNMAGEWSCATTKEKDSGHNLDKQVATTDIDSEPDFNLLEGLESPPDDFGYNLNKERTIGGKGSYGNGPSNVSPKRDVEKFSSSPAPEGSNSEPSSTNNMGDLMYNEMEAKKLMAIEDATEFNDNTDDYDLTSGVSVSARKVPETSTKVDSSKEGSENVDSFKKPTDLRILDLGDLEDKESRY
ncbi:hypothetical protein K7432_006122 [Basidiobolus ranarum]|uniref:Uncharacterized protein n=1 Tax=Basidiobolus ranarum TaxID=34480 RepID=A0ABR2WVJ1_9FUNG